MKAKVRRFVLGMIISVSVLTALILPQFTNAASLIPFNSDGLKISPCSPGGGTGGGRPGSNGKLVKTIHTNIL
jgi:hypothetical protein